MDPAAVSLRLISPATWRLCFRASASLPRLNPCRWGSDACSATRISPPLRRLIPPRRTQSSPSQKDEQTSPMPPAGLPDATPTEIASLQNWISAGYPTTGSATGIDAGGARSLERPPTCTSNTTWTRGTSGSASMEPGMAGINCHASSGGKLRRPRSPELSIRPPTSPTCVTARMKNGAQVVITGATGVSTTLTPNGGGNFYYTGTVATPFRAKAIYMGVSATWRPRKHPSTATAAIPRMA